MAITNPLGAPKFRAFDADGAPLAGGKLYAYEGGTSTPQDTFTTRGGTIANENPVVLDANGEADVWMTAGVSYKFALYDSDDVLQWTVDNFPSASITDASATADNGAAEPGGRLTLTDGTPVTTGDVEAATLIYYEPYKHDRVPIYDGTSWALYSIGDGLTNDTTNATTNPAAVSGSQCYDLFVWYDDGTVRLSRGPAWSSNTSRGTGASTTQLELLDGRWVNAAAITNGPAANCGTYVGTIYTRSAVVSDSARWRHVWNAYNRVPRTLRKVDTTNSWTYSTAAWRQANGDAANQLDMVRGLDEDAVRARVHATASDSGSSGSVSVAVGLDAVTRHADNINTSSSTTSAIYGTPTAEWVGFPGLGRHYLTWLELPATVATMTWFGDAGASNIQSGIHGECLA